jgi:hypothetical protein
MRLDPSVSFVPGFRFALPGVIQIVPLRGKDHAPKLVLLTDDNLLFPIFFFLYSESQISRTGLPVRSLNLLILHL